MHVCRSDAASSDLTASIIESLEWPDLGIFVQVADPTDGRRVFIELSEAAAAKILDYLAETKRAGVGLV
jgi:hypothetical protein